MKTKKPHIREIAAEFTKLGNRAMRKAQEENHRHGLPNIFAKNDTIYYQLPDGTITTKRPSSLS